MPLTCLPLPAGPPCACARRGSARFCPAQRGGAYRKTLETVTVKVLFAWLALTCFALPAQAGQWTIEETDDNYIVEYSSEPAEKPAEKTTEKPALPGRPPAATAASPAAPAATPAPGPLPPAEAKPAAPGGEPAARVRDQSRRERSPRAPRTEE
jgi:hypothetical protein